MSTASSTAVPDAEEILGCGRPNNVHHWGEDEDGNLNFILPSNGNFRAMIDHYNARIDLSASPSFDPANHPQMASSIPPHVQNDQDFADSLIDWEGIAADYAMIKEASSEELGQLSEIELGDDYLSLSEEDQRVLFEAELERTMQWFQ